MHIASLVLVVAATAAGCKSKDKVDCARAGEPVRAELGHMEREAKDPGAREYAKKFAPIAVAAIVQSCRDNKWSAAAVEACSKQVPLRSAMNPCDRALTSDQLAALRRDLGAEKLGGTSFSEIDVGRAVREVRAGAVGPDAPVCAPLAIRVGKQEVAVKRDREQRMPLATLGSILEPLATACIGEVLIDADDDVAYQDIVAAMDAAKAAGFVDVGIDVGAARRHSGVPPSNGVQSAPIIGVTTKAVTLTVGTHPPEAIATLGELDAGKLEAALKKAHRPESVVIVRADAATSAKLLKLIVAAAQRAGFHHLLFAVENR